MERKALSVAAWVVAAGIALLFLSAMREAPPPDFMPFYLGGKLARSGQIGELYHKPAYQPLIAELRSTGERMNPIDAHYFIRPAFQAFLYAPFTYFPYRTALALHVLGNLGLLGALVWKLPQWFALPASLRPWMLCFLPFLWSIGIGQDTLLLTLLAAGALRLAARGREIPAGILIGLCAYKPHLMWAMPLAALAAGKRRMFASSAITGGVLAAVSFLAVGPAGVRQWLNLLEAPSTDFLPHIMGNARALGLNLGAAAGVASVAGALACLAVVLRWGSFGEKFSAAVLACLLLSPHTYWQDYSLAAIVAGLDGRRWFQYLVLLPWPYFYPRKDMLPWILIAMVYLAALAWRAARSRTQPALAGTLQCAPASR